MSDSCSVTPTATTKPTATTSKDKGKTTQKKPEKTKIDIFQFLNTQPEEGILPDDLQERIVALEQKALQEGNPIMFVWPPGWESLEDPARKDHAMKKGSEYHKKFYKHLEQFNLAQEEILERIRKQKPFDATKPTTTATDELITATFPMSLQTTSTNPLIASIFPGRNTPSTLSQQPLQSLSFTGYRDFPGRHDSDDDDND
jgi:hypothetical protein